MQEQYIEIKHARTIDKTHAEDDHQFHFNLLLSSFALSAESSRKQQGSLFSEILSISTEKCKIEYIASLEAKFSS